MDASLKALLSSVVDYAGLFPPAKLELQPAMANYAQYQRTPYSWMLGRFILPSSRLQEFEQLLPDYPAQWLLSIIMTGDLQKALAQLKSLNNPKIAIASLEFPPLPPREIENILPLIPPEVESFFEIPFNSDLQSYLSVLQHPRAAAKIRTGGVTVDAFPNFAQLYQSIFAFAQAQIPFKATAGLHHLLFSKHPVSSEANSPVAWMHGFLNVAILAALIYQQKLTPELAVEILEETFLNNFQFTSDRLSWKDYQLNISEITSARNNFFRSFGSCSFQEPIDDLKDMRLI
ncbi:hypothetical protein H6G41_05995 [Tolypothrix sp. FACHB-123]|uniref:hypothetical protein n=1 Tax=Tolypothrix sp. FACHB-123 TaxID=2692868 RepID=UPI001687A2D1|nr:hypothetical protein [Tolypothrix sp. FACHB-123]MBD2354179.1 hypothetical protein [Tolypothrix sp. FACHB-123]